MFLLIDYGNHPFYEQKKDNNETFKAKLLNCKWNYTSNFSKMNQNLIDKMLLYNPMERYSAI